MQVKLTIQERLKDLRVERSLTLEQLAEQAGLSKSALGKYEADDFKDISPFSIVTLAKLCGVSTDYLLGMTETKNHPDTGLNALHLSDDAIGVLKAGKCNQFTDGNGVFLCVLAVIAADVIRTGCLADGDGCIFAVPENHLDHGSAHHLDRGLVIASMASGTTISNPVMPAVSSSVSGNLDNFLSGFIDALAVLPYIQPEARICCR